MYFKFQSDSLHSLHVSDLKHNTYKIKREKNDEVQNYKKIFNDSLSLKNIKFCNNVFNKPLKNFREDHH